MSSGHQELTERFIQFFRNYCRDDIGRLAQKYPNESRSLYVDYDDLFQFDRDIAEDYLAKPVQMREYAEEALRLYDIPADVSLGQAHVRLHNLPPEADLDITDIRVTDDVVGGLVRTDVYVQEAGDVEAKVTEASFQCQRCGTMNYWPQTGDSLQEPHECSGCERDGPFKIKTGQSEYVDSQTITIGPLPEADTASDAELTAYLEDDLAGEVVKGDRIRLVGVLVGETNRSGMLELHIDGVAIDEFERPVDGFWSEKARYGDTGAELDQATVDDFAARARAVLETQTLDETATRTKIITPFIRLLGWRIMHPEVAVEYTSEALGGQDRADYVLLDADSNPAIVAEAKQEGTYLSSHEGQLKRYMRNFGGDLGLLTNGESFLFLASDPRSDVPEEVELASCGLDELGHQLDTLKLFSQQTHVGENPDQSVVNLAIEQIEEQERIAEEQEVGEFDADVIYTGEDDDEKDEAIVVRRVIGQLEQEYDEGAPVEAVVEELAEVGFPEDEAEEAIENTRRKGELYEPVQGHLHTT